VVFLDQTRVILLTAEADRQAPKKLHVNQLATSQSAAGRD